MFTCPRSLKTDPYNRVGLKTRYRGYSRYAEMLPIENMVEKKPSRPPKSLWADIGKVKKPNRKRTDIVDAVENGPLSILMMTFWCSGQDVNFSVIRRVHG